MATAASAAASDSGASSSTATAKASDCASAVIVPSLPSTDRPSERAAVAVAAASATASERPPWSASAAEQLADLERVAPGELEAPQAEGVVGIPAAAADERADGRGPERRERQDPERRIGGERREQARRAPGSPGRAARTIAIGSSEMRPRR